MLPPETIVTSGSMLLPKAMSGSMVLFAARVCVVLTSEAHVATKGNVDIPGLGCLG